jgi:hypothetical protein
MLRLFLLQINEIFLIFDINELILLIIVIFWQLSVVMLRLYNKKSMCTKQVYIINMEMLKSIKLNINFIIVL